ncbi:hypothetical protein LXT21_40720 [Myxococcus sp. K38C18041901]|uniref:hypothetical protein n=1 Tax=Myxococcus guangdongensis TaxID=2906760 RepID=UPI0020A73AF6|nr:hypothetical protein [Myxococcus guangdongensis]MCP3065115.1 hypothetical protein [Myxococcus guangdongensis]
MAEETPDAQMLAIFEANDFHYASVEEAWAKARHLYPLLPSVVDRFPEERAHQVCSEWLSRVAERIQDARPAAELFAQARSKAPPRQAHLVASKLGDLRNAWVLGKKPAAAAFADGAGHLAEVWAARTSGEEDGETDAWKRSQEASTALVTAWVLHQGLVDTDKEARVRAREALTDLLREARGALPLEET